MEGVNIATYILRVATGVRYGISVTTHGMVSRLLCLFIPTMLLMSGFAVTSTKSKAQGLTCVTQNYWIEKPGGGCCEIEVDICYGWVGPNYRIEIRGTRPVDTTCTIVTGPYLFQAIYRRAILQFNPGGPLPTCPVKTTITFQSSVASCWYIDNDGWSRPCGEGFCIRTCKVCIFPKQATDCTGLPYNDYDVFYSDCSVSEQPCTQPVPGCSISGCGL